MNELFYRGRNPAELKFGTSGLRGLVGEITDLETCINTGGFLQFLRESGQAKPGAEVYLGGDLRPSTDSPERSIMRAVARAVADSGMRPVNLGKLPTPALTHFALQKRRPSIMITGSHIPFDRNGIKFNRPDGEVLKSDEAAILKSVRLLREREYRKPAEESLFDDEGWFRVPDNSLPEAIPDGIDQYRRRYLSFFPNRPLNDMKLLVYQHSAVGRDLVADLLRELGATVTVAGRSDTFIPVDTEAISPSMLAGIQELVDEHQTEGPFDAVVSTDGDSDRPLLLGLDRQQTVIFKGGDLLGILVADFLHADSISIPISANDAVDHFFSDINVPVNKTRIGSPYVIASMQESIAQGARRVVGWEANGGFLTGSDLERDGRMLAALPTRDAVLPILCVLYRSQLECRPIAELFGQLPQRYSRAGLIDAFPQDASRRLLEGLKPAIGDVTEVRYDDDTFFLVRSNGEFAEATGSESEMVQASFESIENYFSRTLGFGRVRWLNLLDGIRIGFANGDIAHLRPSGNAPQLRLYAVADTPERVEAILRDGLQESDGILRQLEKAFS